MRHLLFVLFLLSCFTSQAQKKWSLQDCVTYAMQNNIGVKQSEVQAQIADITYQQSKSSALPTANFSNNDGMRFGKSSNPSTGILENQNYFSVSLGFQTSVQLFNFFSRKNSIQANEWSKLAAVASVNKLKNDLALNVANSYLQVLLAQEQVNIAKVQVQQSSSQLAIVRKQVNAGTLPELNAIEIEAQLANDSSTLVSAQGNVTDLKYALKASMNLDASEDFDIETPPVETIPLIPIADLQPDYVYSLALKNQPQQQVDEYQLNSAKKSVLAAKGALYPSLSAYGALSTNYGYFRTPVYNQIFTGYGPSGYVVSNGTGGFLDVQKPLYTVGGRKGYITTDPLGTQFSNNFGQQFGLSLNIPLLNGLQAKGAYRTARLNVRNLEYQKEQNDANLKQNIYRAYNLATVAIETLAASHRAVSSAQETYDFSVKRYDVGMLTTLELITNQNNLFKAKLQYLSNKYDYVFKMKVLEFYKGQGIKL